MMLVSFTVITLLFNFLLSITESKYGSECLTPIREPGYCLPLRSCAGAYETLLNVLRFGEEHYKNDILFLQQSQCDVINGSPLICCGREKNQINPIVYQHLKGLSCGNTGISKISNGQYSGLYDYRWMALLKYEGSEPFACGGALIDERHVLTAAHCLHNFTKLPMAVRLGEYDLANDVDCIQHGRHRKCLSPVQDILIDKIIPHEDYVYQGTEHDIALVRLERPVNFTKHIRPICLPISETLQNATPEEYLVAGWGITELHNRSNVLLWTAIPEHPNSFCEKTLGVALSSVHICAGGRKFQDTCKGDSGGPLFYPNTYVDGVVRAIQYGVVSFGASRCGEVNVPAVYANVSHYIQWITDHMIGF